LTTPSFTDIVRGKAVYSISGAISGPSGIDVAGIAVALVESSTGAGSSVLMMTKTDAYGAFSFQHVKPGRYVVVPKSKELSFTSLDSTVTVAGQNVAAIDFAAAVDAAKR
jgi:hypothetical protein